MKEKVLVVRRKVLEEIGMFQGMCLEPDNYFKEIWSNQNAFFIDRERAENDPDYKQIIPYVIISCKDSILSYVRGVTGGESRLAKKRSIGFGGHINPIDEINFPDQSIKNVYLNALYREINEEIALAGQFENRIVGLINDDSNEVGKVHLGVVHNWIVDDRTVQSREQEISELEFKSFEELTELKDEMETWSQICYSNLKKIL